MIHAILQADIAAGKVVDVDAYCRMFAPLCPDLTRRQIQDAILQIVIVYGGNAAWGRGGSEGAPQA